MNPAPYSTSPLRKLAVFVEGKTELKFIERMVLEVAGRHNVLIETREVFGGATVPRSMVTLQSATARNTESYFVLIVNCQGDHQVKTRIVEEHQNLTNTGYEKIIGMRDVFPDFSEAEIPKLRRGLMMYIRGNLIPVEFVLSVMEIEAWFLGELNHFPLIDPALSIDNIRNVTGLDLHTDLSKRENPASDLKAIYDIAGIEYKKGAETTLEKLDYAYIYTVLRNRIASIDQLMSSLDKFLTVVTPAQIPAMPVK